MAEVVDFTRYDQNDAYVEATSPDRVVLGWLAFLQGRWILRAKRTVELTAPELRAIADELERLEGQDG